MIGIECNSSKIYELLNEFSKEVKNNKFIKVPYWLWKSITNFVNDSVLIFPSLLTDHNGKQLLLLTNDEGGRLILDLDDNSIGAFFLLKLFVKGDEKDMSITLSNTTSSSALSSNSIYLDKATNTYWSDSITGTTSCYNVLDDIYNISDEINGLKNEVNNLKKNLLNKEESKDMKGFNFDFGPCANDNIRMSMYGLAVKNSAGVYVAYDTKNREIIDVDIFNFDAKKYLFKIPVAIKDVRVGDTIIHNGTPMFVIGLSPESGYGFICVDPKAGEEKVILPTRNMFGFNFLTRVVSLFNMNGDFVAPDANNPFGNMLPLMMLGDNKDIDPMALVMMMNGGNLDMSNPMMMYFMMKDNKNTDLLPMFMMMNMNQSQRKPHEPCRCHGDHSNN